MSRLSRPVWASAVIWLLFVASFFMPVLRDRSMVGWEAAWMYMEPLLNPARMWRSIQSDLAEALIPVFTWLNLAMLVAPMAFWYGPRWSGLLGAGLIIGTMVPFIGYLQPLMNRELNIGYYCWIGSAFLMAGMGFWNWRVWRKTVCHLPRVEG